METESMRAVWDKQYGPGVDSALKDRNLFRLEVDAIIREIDRNTSARANLKLLEIGCGTGALLELLSSHFRDHEKFVRLHGVDFATTAIATAEGRRIPNCEVVCDDVLAFLDRKVGEYDIVVSQRAIMALMDRSDQRKLLQRIKRALSNGGVALLSECFADKFDEINGLRSLMGLAPIAKVWHSLHLEQRDLPDIFSAVEFSDFCSTYMLVTRVIYPYFQEPKHNQPIHQLAASLPQTGSIGFLRLAIVKP